METEGFFDYPDPDAPLQSRQDAGTEPTDTELGFLDDATEQEWETMLAFTQTQYIYAGEALFSEGQTDRAFYLLTNGRLVLSADGERIAELEAPAPLNEIAFLDRGLCAVTATAVSECEVLRLSYDAYESLAVRAPVVARKLLFDIGRIVARALRSV